MISIILCVFNKLNFTKSCLNDLFKLPANSHEIIVIDNASSDGTKDFLSNIVRENFIYIINEENIFHSAACNMGWKISKGDFVLFINNDIRVKSNFDNWTDVFNGCNCVVGPTMGQLDKNLNFIKESNSKLNGNSYISGWCVGAPKNIWKKLDKDNKIWNEKYPFYFNDTDLSFRCREAGIDLNVVSLPIVHFGKISASQINIHTLYTDGRKTFIEDWKNKLCQL